MKKLKVVLLCHYWSEEMAEMVGRKHYFRELSPWIQETLNQFKNKEDVDLHVVAPNYASNINLNCVKDGINFHFYHYSPTWLSRIAAPIIKRTVNHSETYKIAERLANTLTGFKTPAKSAVAIVRAINPDLIHLYGSENPDYSSIAIRLLDEYPILLTVQGFVYLKEEKSNFLERAFLQYRKNYEAIINNNIKFLTTSANCSLDYLRKNNVHYGHFFKQCTNSYYCTAISKIPQIDALKTEKKYDVVFYARITEIKGIEDLIQTLVNIKHNGRALRTIIMGKGSDAYISYLKEIIKNKGIEEDVDFAGFIENHEDVYKFAAQARVMVLPTHNDGIPNTIREAMFMKLPVVANSIGGIPRFNENRHCVHLVEDGNLNELAEGILKVLDDEDYQNELIENAYQEALEVYSPSAVYEQTVNAYRDVYRRTKGQRL